MTISNKCNREIWIGLADVIARQDDCEHLVPGANGAIVHALALAESPAEYAELVRRSLEEMGLDVVEIEELEPLTARLQSHSLHRHIHSLAERVSTTGGVAFGTFHAYPQAS